MRIASTSHIALAFRGFDGGGGKGWPAEALAAKLAAGDGRADGRAEVSAVLAGEAGESVGCLRRQKPVGRVNVAAEVRELAGGGGGGRRQQHEHESADDEALYAHFL